MKEFSFQYFTMKNSVSMDDFTVKIKMGPLRKYEFQFQNIQNFYVFDNKQYRSMYILYTNDSGKTKKVQVFSTPAEMGFDQFVAELQAKIPNKGLNHLSEKEAFAIMKTTNPNKWAPALALIIMLVVVTAFIYPGLRHYFDFGFAQTTAAELGSGKDIGSRNVHITGYALDQTLEETTTTTNHGSTTTSKSVFIPLVSPEYVEGDQVKVMLKFDGLSDDEYQQALSDTAFTGVIRNIAWEGMSKDQIKFFTDHFQMAFPTAPLMIEVTNKEHNDVYAIWVLLGSAIFIGVLFLIIAIKARKNA